jgi:peptidoglycan/LPS O-acetylase OafA/YrhL
MLIGALNQSGVPPVIGIMSAFALMIACAFLLHRYIERPSQRIVRRFMEDQRRMLGTVPGSK